MKNALSEDESTQLAKTVDDALEWMDAEDRSGEEYKSKLSEVESFCNTLVQKAYQSAGGAGTPGSMPGSMPQEQTNDDTEGPVIDEID